MKRVAALLTCHNRKEKTLACLRGLYAQELPPGAALRTFVVDDGSTDGTSDAVRREFPEVNLLHGDGSLFWNQGMRLAFGEALREGFDYYLWLNDDTQLCPDAMSGLLAVHERLAAEGSGDAIIVGSTKDANTGRLTYGGLVRCSRWHPFKYRLLTPSDAAQPCEAMNGNCVMIPASVAEKVGNLSSEFHHGIGDFDYALRALRAGCSVWIAPGYVGTCTRNAVSGSWEDSNLPLRQRWKKVTGPKGLPPKDWRVFCRRYAGPFWFAYWCMPYLRCALNKSA